VFIDDPVLMDALEEAAFRREERWTRQDELNASILEMLHSLYLLTAKANGARNVGKPMRVPRPGDKTNEPVSPGDFARMVRSQSG
jgi:hypothetical protein